ncbi:beta-phosphoglucomutase family hydrolase [Nocardia sp. ET3-3]|uniref:Beta-phosphoglucomutase n=1 Tax=Nocardia terrae TaxID=2675851 RepID=A0A7K1VCJ3_9NOCA|nr:beta-phosphoglucomutase family hydrolase [Nocardia terrae]MVU83858.1 beta-phosphoglucomutase family hydrolase [Nocardia terrae]
MTRTGAGATGNRLGLPETIAAALFDLDGVLTSTAELHERAWKQIFDEFLAARCGPGFRPFSAADYADHVDGRPRLDGVREFLRTRDITVPEGNSEDAPDEWTVRAIGDRKDRLLKTMIGRDGVHVYPGSVDYLSAVRVSGLRIAVVSSSANAAAVLDAADLARFVEVRVDGNTFAQRGLRGKPAPDGFLAAAGQLGVSPGGAAVFEDAVAGVEAGHAGRFGFVVGVERRGDDRHAEALRAAGADVVVSDLAELAES